MKHPFFLYFVFMGALIPLSCKQNGIAHSVNTRLADPETASTLSADVLPDDLFQDVIDCQDLQVVDDTILVVRDQVTSVEDFHFRAFSTTSLRELGSFVMAGRGPGEMLSPSIVHCSSSAGLLVRENSTGALCELNVLASVDKDHQYIVKETPVSPGSLDCIPITDSTLLDFFIDGKDYEYRLIGSDRKREVTVSMFPGFGEEAVPYFSSMFTGNPDLGRAAHFMMFLPQLFIIRADGHVSGVAVDKVYAQWQSVFSQQLGPDLIQYYSGVASDKNYIYASYAGLPLNKLQDASLGSEIHIFDWSGHFVHSINIDMDVDCLAMDSINRYLYCRRRSDHRIVRYCLNAVLD